ncbi:MAG: hypothetical protein Q8R04_00385 [Nanoarchaeota archaeon]|nr:hypothetical protein [Nanoarchaeota archaeon]
MGVIKIQVTSDRLREVRREISFEGVSISEGLPRKLSEATIAIVMGYNPATRTQYVRDAFFNVDHARQALTEIVRGAGIVNPPNGNPTEHTFSIAEGTIGDLEELFMRDPLTGDRINITEVQRWMAYASLRRRLEEY